MNYKNNYKNKTIIIGGSFAGLSTAYFITSGGGSGGSGPGGSDGYDDGSCEIVILERQRELGQTQWSTCGTFVDVLTKLKCEESILKTFDTITFHSNLGSKAEIELPGPICTIDYKVFCNSMADRLKNAGVKIVTGSKAVKVIRHRKKEDLKEVVCEGKSYKGELVVDCSGWRGVTANSNRLKKTGSRAEISKMAQGIESEVEYSGDTGSVHIYFGSEFIKGGYGWVFPVGETRARIGVGGYTKTNILKQMKTFMKLLDVDVDESSLDVHGGLIPCAGLKEPIVDGVFAVGDSCGQVLPVSGEGIRKTVYYAEICGKLISEVLNGRMELSKAQDIYRKEVYESRKFYAGLYLIQNLAIRAPDMAWDNVVRKLNDKRIAQKVLGMYLNDEKLPSGIALLKKVSRAVNLDMISILRERRDEVTIK